MALREDRSEVYASVDSMRKRSDVTFWLMWLATASVCPYWLNTATRALPEVVSEPGDYGDRKSVV